MKVKRLIELLQTVNQEADVQLEGCDCVDEAVGISVPNENSVYKGDVIIRRDYGDCHYSEDGEIQK
jgi:hypothetical protein